ncbi:SPOR domain-containing protein [bacterium]|nr:SPOR domain-containing protein [bacterium]
MLKDTDKFETSSHFSYNDYKKKVHKAPNKDVMVFASVFFIGVLIILGFAKILSPNVDVGITTDNEIASFEDEEDTTTGSVIDERLRNLKLEDEGKKVGDEEMFSPELDERVILPTRTRKTEGQMEAEKSQAQEALPTNDPQKTVQAETTKTTTQPAPKPAAQPEQIVNAKVVVGYYATEKQAEVAKSIIQDAGLGVTPIVKNLGGYYTLQVGSYSSREKAQQAANSLLKSNFPARVIVE